MAKPPKRLSRKAMATMSFGQLASVAAKSYGRLLKSMSPYKWRFILGLLFAVLSGAFNGVIMLAFQFIFAIVLPGGSTRSINIPFYGAFDLSRFIDFGGSGATASVQTVLFCCALVPMLILIRGLLDYSSTYYMLWVQNRMSFDLRNDLYKNILKQSLSFFTTNRSSDLMQTVYMMARMATSIAMQLAQDLVRQPIAIISILFVLVNMDPNFSFYALVVFPLCLLPVIMLTRKVRKAGGREEEFAGKLLGNMQETFGGIRVVKANTREDFEIKRFNVASKSMNDFAMRWNKAMELVGPLVETVASLGIAYGLYYAWSKKIDAAQFMLMCVALMQMYPPAKALSKTQILLAKGVMATDYVFQILDAKPELEDKPDARELVECKGEIRFENVSFSYGTDKPALEDINLHLMPGKSYALVGKTGSGKSTLFSLLMRFYDPDKGRILIDGHDLRDLQQRSFRSHMALVNQDTFLFNDTIYNNIRYGRLTAAKEEIVEASMRAHAHEFISAKPGQYQMNIGDAGAKLSGGQKQRITIARAFLRDAPILLLDEATSALDTETEMQVKEAVTTLSKGRTVIAIAHRLSTVLEADQIIVLHEGTIQAIGRHDELLQTSAIYQRLYQLQFAGAAGEELEIEPALEEEMALSPS